MSDEVTDADFLRQYKWNTGTLEDARLERIAQRLDLMDFAKKAVRTAIEEYESAEIERLRQSVLDHGSERDMALNEVGRLRSDLESRSRFTDQMKDECRSLRTERDVLRGEVERLTDKLDAYRRNAIASARAHPINAAAPNLGHDYTDDRADDERGG